MAMRRLCSDLAASSNLPVQVQADGGVAVAKRLRQGEAFDLVVLAESALRQLHAEGWVAAAEPLADSPMAVAGPVGSAPPPLSSAADLRAALAAARRIGYSTGPSGDALLSLIKAWALLDALEGRLVQAPTGVPVAELLARAEVDIGFQQRSELMDSPGVAWICALPPEAAVVTRFSIALGKDAHPDAGKVLAQFCHPNTSALKAARGMLQPT